MKKSILYVIVITTFVCSCKKLILNENPDYEGVWETEYGKRVPKYITAAVNFQVIHASAPNLETKFYYSLPFSASLSLADVIFDIAYIYEGYEKWVNQKGSLVIPVLLVILSPFFSQAFAFMV